MATNHHLKGVPEIIHGLPVKEECTYTPHYCEENVYMYLKTVQQSCPDKLEDCYCVFISNDNNYIPLWRQSASKQEDGLVVWDYHVIMVYSKEEHSWVFDFDTQLPFPSNFSDYCKETFKSDDFLNPLCHRFFRVTPAQTYLKYFSSDRRHMKDGNGAWKMPPPKYPPIRNGGDVHNLPQYISMKDLNDKNNKFGRVFNIYMFIRNFTKPKTSNEDNPICYPPEPAQPSWLE